MYSCKTRKNPIIFIATQSNRNANTILKTRLQVIKTHQYANTIINYIHSHYGFHLRFSFMVFIYGLVKVNHCFFLLSIRYIMRN